MLAEGVAWFDDWFAIEQVAPGVTAIGEPRFHQFNWNYLITGTRRALLFDTGPGVRAIAPVVRALTTLPVTALPSHLHFDHTGGLHGFRAIAMADLPILRGCEEGGIFRAPRDLFLGHKEGMAWRDIRVTAWLPVGSGIDLGGRRLEVLHTPGHSPDSISLHDAEAGLLFAADFVYPGSLYAQVPGASLADYLTTARRLVHDLPEGVRLFCAHGDPESTGGHRAPVLLKHDLQDLLLSLENMKQSGERPRSVKVNDRMSLLTSEAAFAPWQST